MISWKKLISPPGKAPKDIKEWLGLITDTIKKLKGSENWYDDVTLLTSDSIINDLDTGGANKALSSEQGKILYQKYIEIKSRIDANIIKIINVKELGIKGDGVTNVAIKLNEIINTLEDNTILYFPNGNYLFGDGDINQTISLIFSNKKDIIIRGESREFTKLFAHPHSPCKKNCGIITLNQCDNIIIENLEIDGNLQERSKNVNDNNWGDDSSIHPLSNINIEGGHNIIIENVYSHHSVMDCLQIGRHAGGDTPNGISCIVKNSTFSFGYRQGVTIEGFNDGILENCIIDNTALSPSLINGDKLLGISPRAGIDSETWAYNLNWVIRGCTFENNYVNLNDGTKDFKLYNNKFINSNIISETPSSGLRTFNIEIYDNLFDNSIIDVRNIGFHIHKNTFNLAHNFTKHFNFCSGSGGNTNTYPRGAKNNVFSNNIIRIVQPESEYVYKPNIIYQYSNRETEISNNIFWDCAFIIAGTTTSRSFNNQFLVSDKTQTITVDATTLKNNYHSTNIKEAKMIMTNIITTYCFKTFALFPTSFFQESYKNTRFTITLKISNNKPLTDITVTTADNGFYLEYILHTVADRNICKGDKFTLINSQICNIEGMESPSISPLFEKDGYICIDIINCQNIQCIIKAELEISSSSKTNISNLQSSNVLFFQETESAFTTFRSTAKVYDYNRDYNEGDKIYFPYYGSTILYQCTQTGRTDNAGGLYFGPSVEVSLGTEFSIGTAKFKAIQIFNDQGYTGLVPKKIHSKYLPIYTKRNIEEDKFIYLTDKKKFCYKYNNKWYYLNDNTLIV